MRNRWFVSVAFVSIVLAASPTSRAGEPSDRAQSDSRRREVVVASHVGDYSDGAVDWRSRYAVRPVRGESPSVLEFSGPLPGGASVVETSPAAARTVEGPDGRTVALHIPARFASSEEVALVVRQSLDRADGLRPPLAGPDATQRISLRGLRYDPDDASKLEEYPGYIGSQKFGDDAEDTVEVYLGEAPEQTAETIYLRPSDLEGPRLPGSFTSSAVHRRRLVFVLGGVLVLLGLLAGFAYRMLGARAREERAEAILEEHDISVAEPWEDL